MSNNPYGIEPARVDLIAVVRWNHAIRRSMNDYEDRKPGEPFEGIDYAARTKSSNASREYRARKKAQR